MENKLINTPKKIVVVGPESTGKSTLSAQLAAYYKTSWVKEYAREYLLTNGRDYTFENLLDIAKGQLELEDNAINSFLFEQETGAPRLEKKEGVAQNNLLFVDTDMYVMKVWCEFVFDKCHHWILNKVVERKYDLYLLCNTDIQWVQDELREYPDPVNREKLYRYYKDIMVNQNVPWIDISGSYEERFTKAVEAIDSLPKN